ncbi:MAG TPA: FecR family protein [Usitatibacter sp.]|nr:FecR family protein [Usitatibacter sp.]
MNRLAWGFALFLLAAGPALGQAVKVEAVQYPAWLDRGSYTVPLSPGIALEARDRVRTGANARVLLRLGEGSSVKLGENARFEVEHVEPRGIFHAALQVIAGAFRLTTEALAKRQRRDITIRVATITTGIRGTDVWGKSAAERDLVCLLEGKVTVSAEGHEAVTLDSRGAFYQKPRGGEPQVARVDEKQIGIWSLETEIAPDGAAGRVGGGWRVVAGRFPDRDRALALRRTLREAGYPAQVAPEEGLFAVQVTGLEGEAQARSLMGNLRTVPGVGIPSVGPMTGRAR